MKVLSLLQPWATLVVIGAKKIETRGHNLGYTGEVLIQASLGKYAGPGKSVSGRELCYQHPFKQYINGGQAYDKLPFGAIIGKVNMRVHVQKFNYAEKVRAGEADGIFLNQWGAWLTEEEIAFGHYEGDRWLTLLTDAVQFANPIPCKGQLGVFNCPKEIEYLIPQTTTV